MLAPATPQTDAARLAREAGDRLSCLLDADAASPPRVRLAVAGGGRTEGVELPAAAVRALGQALDVLAAGREVAVVPVDRLLTTQQAADVLDVSRPSVVALLERGEIPFRRVGTHRRVRLADVLAYRDAVDAKRRETLAELAAEAQELGMGY